MCVCGIAWIKATVVGDSVHRHNRWKEKKPTRLVQGVALVVDDQGGELHVQVPAVPEEGPGGALWRVLQDLLLYSKII